MKPLLLFLIIYHLHIVHSHEDEKDSLLFKTYPKKVHQGQMLNAKMINSARFIKTIKPMLKSKKPGKMDHSYTVFPKVSTIIPDSPYFPIDFDFFHKHRERKLLPRNKRSAPANPNSPVPAKVAKVETPKSAVKPAENKPKDNKSKDNKQKDSNPKDNKPNESKPHNNKINKAKPAAAPKKGILKQGNKPAPSSAKVAKPAGKVAKPVSKGVKRRKSRRGVLPKTGKLNGKPNKGGVPRKVGRQGKKPKVLPLRNGTNIKNQGKGRKRKLHKLQKNRKRSRKNSAKVTKHGVPQKVAGRRLIAARDGTAEEYPYMVSIQKDDEHWCSGALLNRRLIASTANCFWKSKRVTRMTVRAGSRHPDQGGQEAKIMEVVKHPRWSIRSSPDNDIALALLDRMLKFSHAVHSVDLPNKAMMPPFDDFWVTSFGAERRDGVYERHGNRLQIFHARLMNHEKCNNITQRFGVAVTENFICLTQYGRRAPCTRDTGAPAVSDGILWGLASWGLRKLCGTERYPSMYTYVGSISNMNFIINATKYLMSDSREDPLLDRFPRHYYVNIRSGHTNSSGRRNRPSRSHKNRQEGDVVLF
ncbi:uncharacterized protein [Choristoneura fumiferana]|uniref:uncharacterized protein n=1 Tax=Choristoneura fumiferana TaxID=7141 RepID=UPI003D156574